MYRATIFSNPRPKHITLAMNAYEVQHTVGSGVDKWGGNHIVNEVFGWPYRGWCSANGNFPWTDIQNNTPDFSPILPPGPGDGQDCDPGQFASFNESYEAHFHSGAYAGTGSHPAQPSVSNIGFVQDINDGSAFLYFSCHGGGTSIAVRNTDNGIAQDPGDAVAWGDDYWPATDGRVYDGSDGSYNQNDLDADLNNVHGAMTAYNACLMANGKMNEVLLEHGGSASFGSYISVSFDGSGWWWNIFVHLISHEGYTIGEAAAYATARIAELYTPGASNPSPVDTSLMYVVYGDPNVHFVQADWTSPEPLEIDVNYGGHRPDKPANDMPTCEIISPATFTIVNGIVSVTGTAFDSDGIVDSVWVKIGSDDWQFASGTTNWQYQWDTTLIGNGFYDIFAKSYDELGKVSSNESVVVTVDNVDGEYYIQWSHNYGSTISDARYQGPQPIGDADNDGDNELLIGGRDGELHVMEWNDTTLTYDEQALITEPGSSGDNPGGFSIEDVTNDGFNEVAVAWDYQFSAFEWNDGSYEPIIHMIVMLEILIMMVKMK
jgi:hypothetical protein